MTQLQTALPISLSQVASQYGASLPASMSQLLAGGGYVPPGTTNGNNALIPSALPVSLSTYLGSPNGIQLSDYVPSQILNYSRNWDYYGSAPPQTYTTNHNPNLIPSGLSGKAPTYNAGWWDLEVYQTYVFANSGLKTSQGCTVIYTFMGGNASPDVPGNTAVGSIVTSPNNVQAFYVWAGNTMLAPTYVYMDYKSIADVLVVVANYACSLTAITKVTVGFDETAGNTAGTWPEVQIIPGNWIVTGAKSYGSGTSITIPGNTFSLTVGTRQGNGGFYYSSQPSSYAINHCGYWYNSGSIQYNFNLSGGNQTYTWPDPGGSESGAVYSFTQQTNNRAGPNVAGYSTVRGFGTPTIFAMTAYDTNNVYSSETASITFMPNGGAYGSGDGGTTIQAYDNTYLGGADVVASWYVGATMTGTPPGNNYWIKATLSSGSVPTSGPALNTWVSLSTNVTWAFNYTTAGQLGQCALSFQIATDGNGTNAVTLGGCTLTVANGSPGGGGGGGACVAISSYLPGFGQAGLVYKGDVIQLADEESLEEFPGEVVYSQHKTQPAVQIVTFTGVTLCCSTSAPIPTQDSGIVLAPNLLGHVIATKRIAADGTSRIDWEEVVEINDLGEIEVQHISVNDRSFWAGEQPDAFILHHNKNDQ